MTKMMRVVAAGVAVCSVSALYAIEWGADNVAVLDVAGATETLSGNQALKGVKVTAANVTLAAEDGAMLALGAGGFTNTAAGTVWSWPTTLGANQIWYTADGASLTLNAPLTGAKDLTFYGKGRVDVYSTNTITGTVSVGTDNSVAAGTVQVYLYPGAKLVEDGKNVTVGANYGCGLHLMGGTNNCNFTVGTANSSAPGGLFVAAGTTNVIAGSFVTQYRNKSVMGVAGHLTIRGGVTATSIQNAQGLWSPFGNSATYANGYLKVEGKPLTVNRLAMDRGTLELAVAGNKAETRGLYISGSGILKTSAADAFKLSDSNKVKMTGGTWDLCGIDQGVKLFCGLGGMVTSETAAKLHVGNSEYFIDAVFSSGKPASSPALDIGTNATVCTTAFTGGAGLSMEGSLDLYVAGASTSTGTLAVTAGRLVMSKADSNASYPGTTIKKALGAWPNASTVEVAGGTLVVEHEAAFGASTEILASGGTIELAEGVILPAAAIRVTDGNGGWTELRGTCGGPESTAANKPKYPGSDTYVFTGKGTVIVGATLPDGWPAATDEASWTQQGSDDLVTTAGNWDPSSANVYTGSLLAHFASGTEARLAAHDFTFLKGVDVMAANFTFSAGEDTTLFLGALGLTNKAAGVTWGWPVSIGAINQVWWLDENTTMDLVAPVSGSGTLTLYGRGRMDVYSTNTVSGRVCIGASNDQSSTPRGEVKVYLHPGAQLAAANGIIELDCRAGWGLYLMGNTIESQVIFGTQNQPAPSALFVEAGTTNVINGPLTSQFMNQSTVGIAGHLTVRGGLTATSIVNAQGRWTPFGNSATYANGYLKVENVPLVANRLMLPRGTLELAAAGNKVETRGLFISGGLLKTSAADAFRISDDNKVKMTGGTWDLCGNDQGVKLFCGLGGTVTSETAATLHVAYDTYFFDSRFSNGAPASEPALGLGTNATVCTTAFAGGAGLSQEGALDLNIAAESATTGMLAVANGRLVMSRADSGASYPGTTIKKTLGAWPTASGVVVTGGVLVVEHAAAFGKGTDMTLGPGGTLNLDYSGVMRVHDLYLLDANGVPVRQTLGSTWGAVGSGARNTSSLITGTGLIMPVGEGIGTTIIFR